MKVLVVAGLLAAVISPVVAQTFTNCNPLNRTDCPADLALGVKNYTVNFAQTELDSAVWNNTDGALSYGLNGAEFTVKQKGDSPTIQSSFYIFFGVCEVIMKAASGTGIVSSVVLQSDDLDEIDWEFIGGDNGHAETNYFGKGNTTDYTRAQWFPVSTPQDTYHNYTTVWSAEKIDWYIDSTLVRTLPYDAANNGNNFPQTPMFVKIGIWAGGDPTLNSPGTVEWAGGETNYDAGPFTMVVQSVRVTDNSTGTEYKYGDTSGKWTSIEKINPTANSTVAQHISEPPPESVTQKFNNLSSTAKIAIYAAIAAFIVISGLLLTWCCIRQRRAGRRERIAEDAALLKIRNDNNSISKETLELMAHQAEMGVSGHGVGNRYYR